MNDRDKFIIGLIQSIDDWADELPEWIKATVVVCLMLIAAACFVLATGSYAHAGECSVHPF